MEITQRGTLEKIRSTDIHIILERLKNKAQVF